MDPETHEKLYRLSTLADAANVSLRTVQQHVEKGLVQVRRVGPYGLPRVPESEFRKYLDISKDDKKK
jgi:predicted site-specific integrase-resolvase